MNYNPKWIVIVCPLMIINTRNTLQEMVTGENRGLEWIGYAKFALMNRDLSINGRGAGVALV